MADAGKHTLEASIMNMFNPVWFAADQGSWNGGSHDDAISFCEWLNWAQPLVMVVGHCNKSPEEMEVLQNEWKVESSNKIAPYH